MLIYTRAQERKTTPRCHRTPHPRPHSVLNLGVQITCLYDMDIPRPDNFNECYLYEGTVPFNGTTKYITDGLQS
jgi:hypothetical protein